MVSTTQTNENKIKTFKTVDNAKKLVISLELKQQHCKICPNEWLFQSKVYIVHESQDNGYVEFQCNNLKTSLQHGYIEFSINNES